MEEWLSKPAFYWTNHSKQNNQTEKTFYQRRYTKASIIDKFANQGLKIDYMVFIAEKPIAEPKLNDNGMLLHNHYYIEDLVGLKIVKRLGRILKYMPGLPYFAYKYYSQRCHYLTMDGNDPNCRQVAVLFSKKAAKHSL